MQNAINDANILLRELDDDGILYLIMNDARRRNALSEAMLAVLHAAIVEAGENAAVRTIILAANGPAFCAGHDLKELTSGRENPDRGKAYFAQVMAQCSGVMQAIVNCPKPIVAQVKGIATAAGCQLVASCDLAIAAQTAQFSTPGVNIGLFCSTPMVALSRNVSNKHAMEMLLTGDMISAGRAAEIGLINQAVEADELETATLNLARKIASKSRSTLSTGKRAFHAQRELNLVDAYDYASAVMVENMLSCDAQEGIEAFIEKRTPIWQDA